MAGLNVRKPTLHYKLGGGRLIATPSQRFAMGYLSLPIQAAKWNKRGFCPAISGQFSGGLDFIRCAGQSLRMNNPTPFTSIPPQVAFQRNELNVIMSLYGRMVAAGEWRDYGISCLREFAVFSVFRHTAENPLYRIEKRPKLRHKQGMYSVVGMDGQILKRGPDLKSVLRVLEKKLIRAVT